MSDAVFVAAAAVALFVFIGSDAAIARRRERRNPQADRPTWHTRNHR